MDIIEAIATANGISMYEVIKKAETFGLNKVFLNSREFVNVIEEIPKEMLDGDILGTKKREDFGDDYGVQWKYGKSTPTWGNMSFVSDKKSQPAYQFKTAESFLKTVAAKQDIDMDLSKYKMGQTVFHKEFGEGIINDIEQEENDLKLDIIFEKVGHKRLMAKYANLEIK